MQSAKSNSGALVLQPKSSIQSWRGTSRALLVVAAFLFGAVFTRPAVAQSDWKPVHPIKIIVPFPPGGGTDATARVLAEAMSRLGGYSVVVENRPGANGIVATLAVDAARPDGYTLLLATSDTHAVNPHLYPQVVKAVKEMVPVSMVARVPVILIARNNLSVKTASEVFEYARTHEMTYAHYGVGSNGQIAMEMIKSTVGIPKMLGIPYQGGGPAIQSVLAKETDLAVVPMNGALAQGDKVLLLGTLSTSRPEGAKQVPTLREQGFDVIADSWAGLYAPPDTPAPVVAALANTVQKVEADAEFAKKLLPQGLSPFKLEGSEGFARYVASESARLAQIIRNANIKVNP